MASRIESNVRRGPRRQWRTRLLGHLGWWEKETGSRTTRFASQRNDVPGMLLFRQRMGEILNDVCFLSCLPLRPETPGDS
jgi:hypothetical protein